MVVERAGSSDTKGVAGLSSLDVGKTSAVLWAIGGGIGVAACLLPHGPDVHVVGWWVVSAAAACVALATWFRSEYISLPLQYVQSVVACGAVSVAVLCALRSPALYATASLYVLATVYAAGFYQRAPLTCYLLAQAAASGAIFLSSGQAGAPAAWAVIMGTATTVGVVVHLLFSALADVADTDPLTALPNRRAMARATTRELARARRTGVPLCLALIDLDGFKGVNDRFGHVAGDRVLMEVAATWRQHLRPGDVLGRFGGDEFIALLPAAGPADAAGILERLRGQHDQAFSAGIAAAETGCTFDDLLDRADSACYEAKRGGTGVAVAPSQLGSG